MVVRKILSHISSHEHFENLPLHDRLQRAIDHAAHLLPAQGPIGVFIHHNTLHAFEHFPFEEAVETGGLLFGCQPYLSEERYREALVRGRIQFTDLRSVLLDDLGSGGFEPLPPFGTRLDLRLAMLLYPTRTGSESEIAWFVAETDALRRVRQETPQALRAKLVGETHRWLMRDLRGSKGPHWLPGILSRLGEGTIDSWSDENWEACTLEVLWNVCLDGVRDAPNSASAPSQPVRHRDLLLSVTGVDSDSLVNDILIRFCATFLDQGVSHWHLPERAQGFFRAFARLHQRPVRSQDRWLHGLSLELQRVLNFNISPLESIRDSLALLGVTEEEWEAVLGLTLLSLRGWAGMIRQTEARGDRVALPVPEGSLNEFVAVRLILERLALAYVAREELGYDGTLAELRDFLRARTRPWKPPGTGQRAFTIFQLAQILGWSPNELQALSPTEWQVLVQEVEKFSAVERRRLFHLAYETQFRTRTLDALVLHSRRKPPSPRFQVITCLDEREESFRRHLEEVAPDVETFGVAGFFAIPMFYRGSTDAHYVPLCPIVLKPKHWVEEMPAQNRLEEHQRLRRTQRLLGKAAHTAHIGSQSLALGALLTGFLGVLASIPLLARTLFPRMTARVQQRFNRFIARPQRTRLALERDPVCEPGSSDGHRGFTVDEMTTFAERLLRDIGLTSGFSRLVLAIGHGSNSLNNPHKSAYDCGACGGSPGAPNARAAAQVLNDPRVRQALEKNGIHIPLSTWFIGGFHNTCDDSVSLLDLECIPESHRDELYRVTAEIEQALERNAHERCRRFMSARLDLTPAEARQHVEQRSEDLSQTRPELGHATNAICYVGRRERTRGLYLDRRAFLTAYDPTQDDQEGTILARTLAAVFPVCGGINLEYYFSHVDSAGYGCGTKLPHNLTSLLGVMDGAASDLRTGLPWQMVEIHEPVRLMIVCETTAEIMQKVLNENPMAKIMTENGWVQLAVQMPDQNDIFLFQDGSFRPYRPQSKQLPHAASSMDWYRGCRDHLEFAVIGD